MKWSFEKRSIEDIYSNEGNPRRISKRQAQELENSIRKFGLCQPIVLNHNGKIIGGHQRFRSLRALGYDTVDAYIPSSPLTKEEENELSIRLNKNVGDWDFDVLANNWNPESLCEWGFTQEELGIDLAAIKGTLPDEEADSVPKEPVTVLGDLYEFGEHRLLCGDCRIATNVETLLEDDKVDMLCTDPPFALDKEKDYRKFFSEFLSLIPWANTNTAYIFISGTNLHNLRIAAEDCGIKCSAYLIWLKNQLVMSRIDYKPKHEFIFYGWKGKHKFYGPHNRTAILEFDRPSSSPDHPTMKPIPLIKQLIEDGSDSDAVVYDAFAGSGTSILACEMFPTRRGRAMEISPAYCDLIMKRWIQYRVEQKRGTNIKLNQKLFDPARLWPTNHQDGGHL